MMHKNWEEYVKNTARIRTLSSPNMHGEMDAAKYYEVLIHNFTEIRDLAADNRKLLKEELYPYLENGTQPLEQEIIEGLRELRDELMDAYNMENLDMTLVARITDRLYEDAMQKEDVAYLIEQLDARVSAYYALMNMQKRILPFDQTCEQTRQKGLEAGERLLEYLDKDRFAKLPDEASKETVLVNARYICSLFEGLTDEASKDKELGLLRNALKLGEDEFYLRQVPEYDWGYHRLRTLEYFLLMMECGNRKGLTPEESEEVWHYCQELHQLWIENIRLRAFITESEILVGLYRAAYFAGELSKEEYKQRLLEQYGLRDTKEYSINDILRNVMIPLEYILLLDILEMSEEEMYRVDGLYRMIQNYVFGIPNSGSLSYLLEYYMEVMWHYMEITGQMTFMDVCLDGIAALHPPTYVHTIMVGRLAKCFCRNLIRLRPEAFVGTEGCKDVKEVRARRFELESFAYQGGLCHDLGKIPIMDTIFTYGRSLTEEEFGMVKKHPEAGARIMERFASTRPYVDIARGHHRWYDNSQGYPEYDTTQSPHKLIIDLVACADCLDAATDAVGRSYNEGKSYQLVFEELIQQSGTRYTPYIVELLQDEATRRDVEYLIREGRKEVYYNTFLRLVKVQKSAE